jgi:hypothetical protein
VRCGALQEVREEQQRARGRVAGRGHAMDDGGLPSGPLRDHGGECASIAVVAVGVQKQVYSAEPLDLIGIAKRWACSPDAQLHRISPAGS